MMAALLDGFACLLTVLFLIATLIGLAGYMDEGKPEWVSATWFIALAIVAIVDFAAVTS